MTPEKAAYILENYRELFKSLTDELHRLFEWYAWLSSESGKREILSIVSTPSPDTDLGVRVKNSVKGDLLQAYVKYARVSDDWMRDTINAIDRLLDEQKTIQHILIALNRLPMWDRELLLIIHSGPGDRVAHKRRAAAAMQLTIKSIETRRRKAMRNLIAIYEKINNG